MKNKVITLLIIVLLALVMINVLFVSVIPPHAMTNSSISESFVRIILYIRKHNKFPESLSVLPKRDGYGNSITDGWGNTLIFKIEEDKIITLSSLGKDGRKGGTEDNQDVEISYIFKDENGEWDIDELNWFSDNKIEKINI